MEYKYRSIFAAIRQQARRRDLINIISFYLIVINTSTIYPEVSHYI